MTHPRHFGLPPSHPLRAPAPPTLNRARLQSLVTLIWALAVAALVIGPMMLALSESAAERLLREQIARVEARR